MGWSSSSFVLAVIVLSAGSTSNASCFSDDPDITSVIRFNEDLLRVTNTHTIADIASSDDPAGYADFAQPRSVLTYVLSHTPTTATVYPTERYYYYNFPLGARNISGNIRFVDVEESRISIGYFDAHDHRESGTQEFIDGEDGISISYAPELHRVDIEVDGIARTFILDQSAFGPPAITLLPGEKFISGVRDESGYYLYLMYWPENRSFYYVLNPTKKLPETWSHAESDTVEIYFGSESRFCFVKHQPTDRYILVGVHSREIMLNSWYDGPFDQVPPYLPIGSILEEAYPYVADAGGIDEHGNFIENYGTRVAISPYKNYESGPTLVEQLETDIKDLPTPDAWTTATYEYKRDWRAPAYLDDTTENIGHIMSSSSAWPANHWGSASGQWGGAHDGVTSRTWSPNHDTAVSEQKKTKP